MANDVTIELHHSGVWNDVTADVRYDPDIIMEWGRDSEAARPSPSRMSLTFDNASGKYSPRHPGSPLFGLIGRNTPIRVLLGASSPRVLLIGEEDSAAVTPDVAALDITGDIDIRFDGQPDIWRPPGSLAFGRKYVPTGDQRSWRFHLDISGALVFRWSPDGTLANAITATSTVSVPDDGARRAVRVTLDVNNGASQHEVKFWTAPTIDGAYTQLGATVTTAGVTSIFSSSADVEIGRVDGAGVGIEQFSGDLFGFEIRNGIDGTLVADLDPTTRDAGDTSWTDSVGRAWTLSAAAHIVDPAIRFAGEVASWPTRWDLAGVDVRVPIEAAGVRRRLGQGVSALRSALYRGFTSTNVTTPVGYWPMEDGKDSTSLASGLVSHPALSIFGDVQLAAFSDAPASDAIPTITLGRFTGTVPGYTSSDFARFMLFVNIPDTIAAQATIFQFTTSGSAAKWRLQINTDGTLRLLAFGTDNTVLLDATYGFDILGTRGLIWLLLTQDGQNIVTQTGFQKEGDLSFGFAAGSLIGHVKGNILSFQVGSVNALNSMAVGHVVVMNTSEFWNIAPFARAWSGETAIERVTRLCEEEDVPLRIVGHSADAQAIGPQRIATFLELVDTAADVDQGILTDDRDALRLLYRSGHTLYNQDPAVTLDYAGAEVAETLEPVDDDQLTRNDITVSRPDGSSARVEELTGPLSVLPPPDGVGRYDEAVEVNVNSDGALLNQAGWRLHLGTVDEPRYPKISVDLTAVPSLTTAATAVSPGDRVRISNPPAWLPPGVIDQLAQGGREALTPHRHLIEWNATPASPWDVAKVGDTVFGKADTEDSTTTASFISGTNTSMTVATNRGPIWTTAAGQFPFDITVGGVVLTVTAISGASPQTFTVTQAPVNGVIKTIPAGTALSLAHPAIVAL